LFNTGTAGVHREKLPRRGDETTLLVPPTNRIERQAWAPSQWSHEE